MSVLTECSTLWNYQSITTCSELMSNIILHYISKCIKGIAGRIKLRKEDFYLKSFFSRMVDFPTSHLNFKVAIKTKRMVLKVTKSLLRGTRFSKLLLRFMLN